MSESELFAWVVLPILIFFARVIDVTLGTIRIILVSRGQRRIAPLLGFFEVLIWVIAIGQVVQNLSSVTSYLGYAGGFAAGNYVGMLIEDRLALGTLVVRTFMPSGGDDLVRRLREAGFGVTAVDGQGATGPVKLVFTVVKRKQLKKVTQIIHEVNPKAFLTIEDVRSTEEGIFPQSELNHRLQFRLRKGK
ncbi:MAG TPA: DUF2179 domain-containing protein [Anaerolineaceae bacterium]|jgi:uncharacterized protein YebE (UPF0316 family)|nr:DUF2179 domain-containing protein [Anaerolineaceae bacterium]